MKELIYNLKFAWRYAKNQKKLLVLYLLCNIFQIIISVFLPVLSAKIIVSLSDNQLLQVLNIALVLLVTELFRNCVVYLTNFFSQKFIRKTFLSVKSDLV
jgi:ABC-type multidrug transport system fused ATPase/permease subunit